MTADASQNDLGGCNRKQYETFEDNDDRDSNGSQARSKNKNWMTIKVIQNKEYETIATIRMSTFSNWCNSDFI